MLLPRGVLSARAWWRACAAFLLLVQISADGAAALPHPGDVWTGPATLESHHTAQCVRVHDAAQCAQCQYHATRPLPAVRRRLPLTSFAALRIGSRRRPQFTYQRPRDRAVPPRAPPSPLPR